MEQDEPGDGEHSLEPTPDDADPEGKIHQPGSGDIDGMDDDAGEEQELPPTGCWTATSSYDIYMVDTPQTKQWQ